MGVFIIKKYLIIFSVLLVSVFLLCGAASAATVKTNNINSAKINVGTSTAHYPGYEPAISGTRVVWVGYNKHSAIYYKNLAIGTSIRLQPSTQNQVTPDISGKRIVWSQEISSNHYAIFYKNLATGKTIRLSKSSYNQYNPAISGTMVVWEQKIGIHKYIWLKNLSNGYTAKIGGSTSNQKTPAISGTRVVWEQNSNIYTKNLLTGTIKKVKPSRNYQFNPDISGTRIIWQEIIPTDYLEAYTNICLKNLANGYYNKIKSVSNILWNLKIDGSRVIWAAKIGGNISLKNLVSGVISTVHGYSAYDNGNIAISGNNVLWTGNDGGPIYVENLTTKNIKTIKPRLMLPDLKIADIKIINKGDDNTHGHLFDITLTLKNIGLIASPSSHVIVNANWQVTGQNYNGQTWMGYADNIYFPVINPGSSVTLTIHGYPINVYPYQNLNIAYSGVDATVDPNYKILESNENNNYISLEAP